MIALALGLLLLAAAPGGGEEAVPPKTPVEFLGRILDLQRELAANPTFQAQAPMLGALLQEISTLSSEEKIQLYEKVIKTLETIKAGEKAPSSSPIPSAAAPEEARKREAPPRTEGPDVSDPTRYVRGEALLELFNTDSFEKVPQVPVVRTIWKEDLARWGKEAPRFLVPGKEEVLAGVRWYLGLFSFYYRATAPGLHSFSLMRENGNRVRARLLLGGALLADLKEGLTVQGIVNLEPGFHRAELWVLAENERWDEDGHFKLLVLPPDGFDGVLVTKDMIYRKTEKASPSN